MLQYEDITKVQEIKGKFKKVWLSSEYLNSHLNILGFNKITKQFDWCKKSGYTFKDLISILLILPIIGISSVFSLSKNKDADINNCGKDSYYRLLSNQNIDWRSFLYQFVMQYLLKEELFTPEKDATKCLIFDDSDLAKTGKTIEGVSKIYNHVSKSFYLGYKILVAGY